MAYPAPYSAQPGPAGQENQLVQQLSMPIYQARGWLKFLGVLSIISGVTSALSIVGIIFAWLPIWMGVLMFQAGSAVEPAGQFGDKFGFLRSLGNLKTYFVLQGVLSLVGIVLTLLMICVLFVFPLLGLTLIPWQEIINNNLRY
jgi:hypothetical protein